MSLLEVAQLHKVDLEGPCEGGGGPKYLRRTENWVEHVFGEGPTCGFCHVQISSAFDHLLNDKFENETELIERHWNEEAIKTSRLACLIKLQKKHDGLVVYVPDAQPVNLI
jgi:ferredoxin